MTPLQFQKAAGIGAGLALRWYQPLIQTMQEFNITDPVAQAMFIAQAGHESAGFTRIVESFNYSVAGLKSTFRKRLTDYQCEMLGRSGSRPAQQEAIANLVYANRGGNSRPGDGWRYRGRGWFQVTFLNNYRACGNALGVDLVVSPELLEQDVNAARSAGWYWRSVGCQRYAGDLLRVTQLINGGTNGIDDRRARFERARAVLA